MRTYKKPPSIPQGVVSKVDCHAELVSASLENKGILNQVQDDKRTSETGSQGEVGFRCVIQIGVTLALLLIFAFTPLVAFGGEAQTEIRVQVIDGVKSVTIEGLGSPLKTAQTKIGKVAKVAAGESGLVINGKDRGAEVTFLNSTERYRVGERTFKGELSVIWLDKNQLTVVDHLQLEDYLSGLINSEISSSWPLESIKAQAVAARTYAMNQIEGARKAVTPRPFDIRSTTLDQVYDGTHQEDSRSKSAVLATKGEMLLRGGNIFSAYYHSCCGGETEHAYNVWPGEKGPPIIKDSYCERSPKFNWSWQIPVSGFIQTLKSNGTNIKIVRTVATTSLSDSSRVGELLIEDEDGFKMIKATELRKIFGYQNIKSTWFEVAISGNDITFTGRGYGHGVGLCQWGAKGMAEAGKSYREILKFYYPDAEIVRLY